MIVRTIVQTASIEVEGVGLTSFTFIRFLRLTFSTVLDITRDTRSNTLSVSLFFNYHVGFTTGVANLRRSLEVEVGDTLATVVSSGTLSTETRTVFALLDFGVVIHSTRTRVDTVTIVKDGALGALFTLGDICFRTNLTVRIGTFNTDFVDENFSNCAFRIRRKGFGNTIILFILHVSFRAFFRTVIDVSFCIEEFNSVRVASQTVLRVLTIASLTIDVFTRSTISRFGISVEFVTTVFGTQFISIFEEFGFTFFTSCSIATFLTSFYTRFALLIFFVEIFIRVT